jgi:hypothetical protein
MKLSTDWEIASSLVYSRMKVIEAELLGMTAANLECIYQSKPIAYSQEAFIEKAVQLQKLADALLEAAERIAAKKESCGATEEKGTPFEL